eukprot:gene16109-19105_t
MRLAGRMENLRGACSFSRTNFAFQCLVSYGRFWKDGIITGFAPLYELRRVDRSMQITPKFTAVLTLLTQVPCYVAMWRRPTPDLFLRSLLYANLCGFMAGWHVHEKACLGFILPLALMSVERGLSFMCWPQADVYGLERLLLYSVGTRLLPAAVVTQWAWKSIALLDII